MNYHDILYEKRNRIATITINRPDVLNAFRAEAVEEMLDAMRDAEGGAKHQIGGGTMGFAPLNPCYVGAGMRRAKLL